MTNNNGNLYYTKHKWQIIIVTYTVVKYDHISTNNKEYGIKFKPLVMTSVGYFVFLFVVMLFCYLPSRYIRTFVLLKYTFVLLFC